MSDLTPLRTTLYRWMLRIPGFTNSVWGNRPRPELTPNAYSWVRRVCVLAAVVLLGTCAWAEGVRIEKSGRRLRATRAVVCSALCESRGSSSARCHKLHSGLGVNYICTCEDGSQGYVP